MLLAFGASAAPLALAQSCGSGGGATVCLSASGSANNNQLNWTVSGNVSRLEVYRDTDADPNGRSRIAVPASSVRSYADASANTGTPYWYWVKFTTSAGSYNSGSASATRGGTACTPTAVSPWIATNGSWTQTSSATVTAGNSAILGPQPINGGSWSWSGCGTSGSAREQTITPPASCTATATYTNACGAKTTQAFVITVPGSMRDLTSIQLSKEMSPAWNLGNSVNAVPDETSWGNAPTSQQLLNAVKAAGFKTVRIGAGWSHHADADGNVSPAWMARVAEIVGYARNAGLYVVLNNHETEWTSPTYANQPVANARLAKLWTQIANYFKNYDDYLLFAGTNEIMFPGDYGPPTAEYQNVQNGFNQIFVNAVRATGGNNAKRHLVVQGFNTNINSTYDGFIKPADSVTNRLFLEVHFYDPYNFALNSDSNIWQWGAIATNPAVTETWANEAYVDAQFQKMKTRFVDAGIPVLMGEYGAILRTEYDPAGTYRTYWTKYVTKSMVQHGIVPTWWDPGYGSNHATGLFDRATGNQYFPDLIKTIVDNSK
jgi:endoglucanase